MKFGSSALVSVPLVLVLASGCASSTNEPQASTAGRATAAASSAAPVDMTGMKPDELLAKATAFLKSVDSVGLKGSATASGAPVSIDYTFMKSDSGGAISEGGTSFELRSVDGMRYLKLSDSLLSQFAGSEKTRVLAQYSGKWLRIPAGNSAFGDLTTLADRSSFVDGLLSPSRKVSRGTDKQVNGIDCIALTDNDKSNPGTLYLARTDLRPIQISNTGAEGGSLDFSYEGLTAPQAPPAAEVLDAPTLGG